MSRRTVPALLRDAERRFGSGVAVVDGGAELTWRELASAARRVGSGLRARGVARGDRVAVWAPNSLHWVVAALGVHEIGAVLVPLNTRYTGPEACDILRRARVRLLLTVDGFLGLDFVGSLVAGLAHDDDADPAVGDVVAGLPDLRDVVLFPGDRGAAEGREVATLDWDRFLDGASDASPDAGPVDEHDLADVVFTSGTTGRSKGVMTRQRQTVECVQAWVECAGLRDDDRYLIASPFSHTFGYKAGLVACVATGATMYPVATFDVDHVLRLLHAEGITVVPGPPTILQSLLDASSGSGFGGSRWRIAVTGSAAVPVRLVERLREAGVENVLTAYGLSEAVVVTMCRPDDPAEVVATTAGRPVAGFEVRVRAGDGGLQATGLPGEIELRGPNLMVGYLDDPAATSEVVDCDGWFRTGDVGTIDDDGYVSITDRIKNMYTVGGFNVYPAEVENALARLEGIRESAVVGVPDERLGSVGRAYVVRPPGADRPDADDVLGHCRARLANFKVPREIRFLDRLPRNAAGKVVVDDLRRL